MAHPPRFVPVVAPTNLPPGAAHAVRVGDRFVALFNVGGAVHATDNVCPHAGGPLARGRRGGPCGEIVTCPWHGWRFNVRTGEVVEEPASERLATYPVRIEAGEVWIGMPS